MELYNSNSEKHPYSLTVQGKLLNSAKITKIRKVSSTKAKIIWKILEMLRDMSYLERIMEAVIRRLQQ